MDNTNKTNEKKSLVEISRDPTHKNYKKAIKYLLGKSNGLAFINLYLNILFERILEDPKKYDELKYYKILNYDCENKISKRIHTTNQIKNSLYIHQEEEGGENN